MSEPGARRRQAVGFILSGIFPGLGQLYNREYLKGVLFIIPGAVLTWLVSRALPADLLALAQPGATMMLLLATLLALWLWAIIDAWRVAGGR
jgi:arabinogalactan oligomer/maltooligosaccharide transport system permease protein